MTFIVRKDTYVLLEDNKEKLISELVAGDILQSLNGKTVKVVSVNNDKPNNPERIYNLQTNYGNEISWSGSLNFVKTDETSVSYAELFQNPDIKIMTSIRDKWDGTYDDFSEDIVSLSVENVYNKPKFMSLLLEDMTAPICINQIFVRFR